MPKFEQPQQPLEQPDKLDDMLTKAKSESKEGEFDPEAERQKIYARASERRQKLFYFRREVFEKAGKVKEAEGYKSGIHGGILHSPSEYAAFEDAHSRAINKTKFQKIKDDEAGLTYEEQAALLYQRKYNEIQRDMELAIDALEEKIKASKLEEPKPEEAKDEELKVEKPKLEDMEKMMSEI